MSQVINSGLGPNSVVPLPMPLRNLRLVASQKEGDSDSVEERATPCLVLKSAMRDNNVVNVGALYELFLSLQKEERIEFVHSIHRDEAGNTPARFPYRMRIRVAATKSRLPGLKGQVEESFASAFPGFHFIAGGAQAMEPLPAVMQFVLLGVVAQPKPASAKFEADLASSAVLNRVFFNQQAEAIYSLPYPEDLPDWALSAPFLDPLSLPDATEISIRIHGISLEDSCEELARTVHRLQSGSLTVFHPDSPISPFSAASQLLDPTVSLLRLWMQHPRGFGVDCVVRSSVFLGQVAQKKIMSDVFGKRPSRLIRSFNEANPEPLAKPDMSWAIARGQGLPALMPAKSVQGTLGIPKHFAAPAETPPKVGTYLGSTVCGRRSSEVHLPFASRSRHTAIFGSTGSGKSTLLTQMVAEDIADPERKCGVGLLDPHGALVEKVLELIPPERADDVVLVDVSDPLSTACINPLEGIQDPMHANFVVGELMSLIDNFENRDTGGPVTRSHIRNLLLLTAATPRRHPCLLDAVRVLTDSDYCDYLLSKTNDRSVSEYWACFRKSSGDHGFLNWVPYIIPRLDPFVSSPIMKRLINRPDSTIDLAQAMRDKKIVLFNLNKATLGDTESQVLGSIVLAKFFAAAMGRAAIPEDQRTPFHLYVDEFSSIATDSTPRLFSEARKWGLGLTVAFQSISQLENKWGRSNISHSVLANTATKFMMRLGVSDTPMLLPYFQPQFDTADMTNLPDFHAVAAMQSRNRPVPPFVFKVNLANKKAGMNLPVEQIVERSRARYCVPIQNANRELSKLFSLELGSLGPKSMYPELALEPKDKSAANS